MPPEAPVVAPSRAEALLRRLAAPGALLGGRYRPHDILGQGGMGLVVHAVDTKLGRDVAIKWLLPELARDPALVARFASEATALARIHHPNVVQILDVADADAGTAYYVMEFVPGVPLTQRLRQGPLPWPEAYDVLLQTAHALAAIHGAGLVHRDVKPSNLLCLETSPGAWHVKVIDFGIARTVGTPRLTQPGELLGTLPYMAPEQFAGLEGDRRTDVYGWGVLALELLGRVSPAALFGPENLAGAPLRDAVSGVLERARVQPRIAAIVRGALATAPDERWSDMDEVTDRLRALDDGGAPTLIYHRPQAAPRGNTVVAHPSPVPAPADPADPDEPATERRPSGEIVGSDVETLVDGSDAHREVPPRTAVPESGAVARPAALIAVAALAIAGVVGVGWSSSAPATLDGGVLDDWPTFAVPIEPTPTPVRAVEAAAPSLPPTSAPLPSPAAADRPPTPVDPVATPPDTPRPSTEPRPRPAPSGAELRPPVPTAAPAKPAAPPDADAPPPEPSPDPKRLPRDRPRDLKDPFG